MRSRPLVYQNSAKSQGQIEKKRLAFSRLIRYDKVLGYEIMLPSLQYTAYLILAPLAALTCIIVAAYARLRYPSVLSAALVWLNVPTVGWLVANTLELVDPTQAGTLFWSRITYTFIAFTPVAWLAFALRLAEFHDWLRLRRFWLFCILPTLTIGMVWTNDLHHWLWRAYHFTQVQGMLAINVDYGPYFWVQVVYSYGLVFVGAAMIIWHYLRSFQPFQLQSRLVVIGALTPVLFNIVYIFRLLPWLKKDYTAISFALAVLAFAVAIRRYRLFDLRPLARATLVDSLPDTMLALDLNGRLVDMNPAAETLLGLSSSAIGQFDREVLPDWLTQAWRRTENDEAFREFEIVRHGRKRTLELRTSLLKDQRGRSSGWLVVLSDITAHKQAQQSLRQRAVELEASNAELDAFAHTVAHDLKNPLAALLSASEMLRLHVDSMEVADVQRMAEITAGNTKKMANIIDELLLLSSVRKLSEITVTPLNMGFLVGEALNRLAEQQAQSGAQVNLPDQWPSALGYGPWIEEVWVNYISNALNYGGEPPLLELGGELFQSDGRQMARFWVHDNGPGIPLELQKHLFRPFSRLDTGGRTTPTRVQGHGLGLSIVLRIVEKLGGHAGLDSQPGEGCRFWFTLPTLPPGLLL